MSQVAENSTPYLMWIIGTSVCSVHRLVLGRADPFSYSNRVVDRSDPQHLAIYRCPSQSRLSTLSLRADSISCLCTTGPGMALFEARFWK